MVNLNYRKYDYVSNQRVYNMLGLGLDEFIADIPWQKPNITRVVIN